MVRINGVSVGVAPLFIRKTPGRYLIELLSNGYISRDTLLVISDNQLDSAIVLSMVQQPRVIDFVEEQDAARDAKTPAETRPRIAKPSTKKAEKDAPLTVDSASRQPDYAAQAEEAKRKRDWEKAIALYEKLIQSETAPEAQRQDALFTIAKIQREYMHDAEAARETFLRYLALYPGGYYAGESLLRLAEIEFPRNDDMALGYYEKFLDAFPNQFRSWEIRRRVGLIYLQKQRYHTAATFLKDALMSMPHRDKKAEREISSNLYRALKRSGAREQARLVYETYLSDEKDENQEKPR